MQGLSVGTDYRSTIGSNGRFKNLERFLSRKMIFRLFLSGPLYPKLSTCLRVSS